MESAEILQEFTKYGIIGVLFFLSLLALRSRDASYRESQEKRITEAQQNTERFLLATQANTQATQAAADGFKALTQSNEQIKLELRGLSEKLSKGRRS